MGVQSGMKLTPARLNAQVYTDPLLVNYALTGSLVDIDCVVFPDTYTPNAVFYASWSCDWQLVTAGGPTGVVSLVVDGVQVPQPVNIWAPANVVAGARETVTQTTTGILPAAGAHSFRLRAQASGSGAIRLNAMHTFLSVLILP